MSDPAKLAAAILAGPLPSEPFIAALPMYDWPEARSEVDAQWAVVRVALRKKGVDAPERLIRRNADLPPVPGGIRDGAGKVIAPDPATLPPDEFDLAVLWQHPNLLLAQTCWGPLKLWLKGVRVVGQEDYSGIEGGEGEEYSSAVVMARGDASKVWSETPLSACRHLPREGGDRPRRLSRLLAPVKEMGEAVTQPISPLAGEMSDRTERGGSLRALPTGLRLAFNAPDSMSGLLALQRDLEAQGSGLQIFNELVKTGGHRASIRAVAEGRADVAAVDCKTWALARRLEPVARKLAVVGWTGRRMGLPFVTAAR